MATIGIIGGGFAGAVVAYWLARLCPNGTKITVFEPSSSLGRGIAYMEGPDHLLLNVPARYLTPIPGDQQHFLRWLIANRISELFKFKESDGAIFVPRAWFGDYIGAILSDILKWRGDSIRFLHQRTAVCSVETGDPIRVITGEGQHGVDHLILTLGTAPPRPLSIQPGTKLKVVQSAWQLAVQPPFPDDWNLAIVGSGLTMADTVAELTARKHRGPITVVSRHGLMPLVSGGHLPEYELPAESLEITARLLLRQVRRWARGAETSNIRDWRPVVDEIRKNAPAFWQVLSDEEQFRFRRHIRTYWETHRYPVPPATFRVVRKAIDSGQLIQRKGLAVGVNSSGLQIRHAGEENTISADLVVNASGPDSSFETSPSGGLEPLLAPLGLDCAQVRLKGLVIDNNGLVSGCQAPFQGRVWSSGFLARRQFGEPGTINAIAEVASRSAARIGKELKQSNETAAYT